MEIWNRTLPNYFPRYLKCYQQILQFQTLLILWGQLRQWNWIFKMYNVGILLPNTKSKMHWVSIYFLLQCPNGHTLCSSCKARVHNHCPTCRHELGNIRCLALEKVAESLELPCRYQSVGCSEIFPYYGKLKHEQQCRFRPYSCPYAGAECLVTGDVGAILAHLKDDHKVDMHDGCTFNHRYVKSNPHEVENATWMLTVFALLINCN